MNKPKPQKVTFLLTPRPQRDPLAADNEAPPNVLLPKDGSDLSIIKERLQDVDPQVFVSETETKKGMLERAHKPDGGLFDTDILKAMSQDFDFADPNNIIDDDFITQAGGLIEEDEGDFEEFDLAALEDEMDDEEPTQLQKFTGFLRPAPRRQKEEVMEYDDEDEEDEDEDDKKTIFTNYSMTSSAIHRNQGLQEIDEHFERLYENEYSEQQCESPAITEHPITKIDQVKQMKKEVVVARKRNRKDIYKPELVSDHHKNAIIGDSDNEGDLIETEITKRENRIDCESILSYNSTLYNHPKLLVEGGKRRKLTKSSDVEMEAIPASSVASSRASILSRLSVRPPNETREDKRERKKALKLYRHERRQERKHNQSIFMKEKANLDKQERNNQPVLKLV